MNTSNFAKSFHDPAAVAICRVIPKNFRGRVFGALAPSRELLYRVKRGQCPEAQWKQEYCKQVLAGLDPHRIAEDLGPDAVLLCYEGEGKACHRHYVAEWFRSAGIECEETPYPAKEPSPKQGAAKDWQMELGL